MGHEDVEQTIAIVITHAEPHAGLLASFVVERGTRHQTDLPEGSIAVIVVQQVGHHVIGDVDVGPSVVVEVAEHHAETAVGRSADARFGGHVHEGAVAIVSVQRVGFAHQPARTAEHVHAQIPADVGFTPPRYFSLVETQVVGNVEVHVAVAVVVTERTVGAPPRVADAGSRSGFRERAVAVVSVQDVRAIGGEVKIAVTIVVVVGHADAHAPTTSIEIRFEGDVDETSSVVPVEGDHGVAPGFVAFEGRPVRDQDIPVPIVVIVEEARTVSVDLDDVVLGRGTGDVHQGNARLFGHIRETGKALSRGETGGHAASKHQQQSGQSCCLWHRFGSERLSQTSVLSHK